MDRSDLHRSINLLNDHEMPMGSVASTIHAHQQYSKPPAYIPVPSHRTHGYQALVKVPTGEDREEDKFWYARDPAAYKTNAWTGCTPDLDHSRP